MYEDSLELECAICVDSDTSYFCECGANDGMPNIDTNDADTGVRYALSAEQARLYNTANWKSGLALILRLDGSYELFDLIL